MNTNNIYYACLIEIIGKQYKCGERKYVYKINPLGFKKVYKIKPLPLGFKYSDYYIDLESGNKYKLYSQMLNCELEVGKIVIDDKNFSLMSLKDAIDKFDSLRNSQIEIKKHMTKRKILRMISGGKK